MPMINELIGFDFNFGFMKYGEPFALIILRTTIEVFFRHHMVNGFFV